MDNIKWIRFPCKRGTRLKAIFTCPRCGKKRWVMKGHYTKTTYTGLCKSCRCTECSQLIGEKNFNWKGGKYVDAEGYCLVKIYRDHPFYCMAKSDGYVLEHRLVYAQHIGRPLRKEEVVHHIDENRVNNAITNLRLFPSVVNHLTYHRMQRRLQAAV